MSYAEDLFPLTQQIQTPTIPLPTDIDENKKGRLKIRLWEAEVNKYWDQKMTLTNNLIAMFAIMWGQCSSNMKAKLQSVDKFEVKKTTSDVKWLLKEIKGILFTFNKRKYMHISLQQVVHKYYTFKQGPKQSIADYLEKFRFIVKVVEHYRGAIGHAPTLIKDMKERFPDSKKHPIPDYKKKVKMMYCN